jgi:hypothetical protein
MDVARAIDATIPEAQIDNDTWLNSTDDPDAIYGMIESAESEFYNRTNTDLRVSREGTPGVRESYESVTYELSGHKQYRRNFSHGTYDYSFREGTVHLNNERVMPFDPDEDDEAYVYWGLSSDQTWEDITDDRGDFWDIIDHRAGLIAIDPNELLRARSRTGDSGIPLGSGNIRNLRINITYRHGALDRSQEWVGTTTLAESIDDTQTGAVEVADLAQLPSGVTSDNVVVTLGSEHIHARIDRDADRLDIQARGVRGTEAQSHSSGDDVTYVPPQYRKAVAARAGMELLATGRYRGYLPDTEADIDNSEAMDELERMWSGTVEALSE